VREDVQQRADARRVAAAFAAGGAVGALMHRHDWSATPLGPVSRWPACLVDALAVCLRSRQPMVVFWGPQFAQIYNDAYRAMLGGRHPQCLGQPVQRCWPEAWDRLGPALRDVLARGEASVCADVPVLTDRHGCPGEAYVTFSCTPIEDPSGVVCGALGTVVETTGRVVGERRLRAVADLAARTAGLRSPEATCRAAAAALAGHPQDVPFAVFYLLDPDGQRAITAATAGLLAADPLATDPLAATVDLSEKAGWPLAEVVRTGESVVADAWPPDTALAAGRALVLPITPVAGERPEGLLVAGLNPRLALDDGYREFLTQIAGHVAAALGAARAHERERRHAETLTEIDRAKTAFFSNVSHEFRTPLTLLLDALEELAAGTAVAGPQRERVRVAHRSALRVLRLVDTMLTFARLESGRARATYEPVELASLTTELASMFGSAVERAGLVLTVDCPPLREPVYVDRQMWETIVLNLVSNAFKHTFVGRIDVTLRETDGAAELTVRDTGVGIPADQIPHLFQRFHRVPGVRARTREGSGIGLSLVAELVALHGGTVQVTSEPGRGSAFTVRIPTGSAHLPPDQVDGDRREDAGRLRHSYVEEALRWLPDTPSVAMSDPPDHAVVLVADDNADMRAHLRRALGRHWTVRLAPDGQTALRMARTSPPDVVVTDVMMPGLDGFSLLRELRADPRTSELPVIMLTARAGRESIVEGLEAGADDYLVKPFTTAELVARVHTHLRTARVRQRATLRMRSLANASHALSTSLDVGEIVDVLTTLVVPQWADECVVWLREQTRTGEWRLVARTCRELGGKITVQARTDAEAAAEAVSVARALGTGRPHQARLAGGELALTLPLRARGDQLGALTVARRGGAPWRPTDLEYLTDLARRLALALDNAARYEAERSVAVTLQRSLLPSELPTVPGVDLAARYQPGGRGTSVGGDWYDAFPLPDGRLALAIGDVMGRGVRAAAIMGQLRAALRGYALENLPPAQLLTRLDAFVEASGEPHLSTCLYATYDPAGRRLRIAAAGHLPPLLVTPGGASQHVALPVGLPLGAGAAEDITYADHELTLTGDSLLVLYTDGLIETREHSLDTGMRTLEALTRRRFRDAEAACEHLLAALGPDGDHADDTTILALHCGSG
jgi:signal transduction histidine kinase/DNA-binding NarL/FixJ family response regulator